MPVRFFRLTSGIMYFTEQFKAEVCLGYVTLVAALLLPLAVAIKEGYGETTAAYALPPASKTATAGQGGATLAAPAHAPVPPTAPSTPTTTTTPTVPAAAPPPPPAPVEVERAVWPIHGVVTTEFGYGHNGMDIASRQGSGVIGVAAFRSGQVARTVWGYGGYGNHVIVDHGNGVTAYYAHLSAIHVQQGQFVKAGDILGLEGNTGYSTGPHLHFEIRENNRAVNPRGYITGNPQ